jgi:hypothetical protein
MPGEVGDPKAPAAGTTATRRRADGRPLLSYEEMRAQLCERYGWTFDQVDELDFDRLASAWRGGKRPKGVAVDSDDDVAPIGRHWRRYYHGL